MASGFTAELLRIPPVTRFLCAAMLVVSLPVMLQPTSEFQVDLRWKSVFKKLQIWRIFTNFFLGGPKHKLNYIFDFVTLYRTSNGLETRHFRRGSADYLWQLVLIAGAILIVSYPLDMKIHTHALLTALIYLSSQLAPPGTQKSILGLFTIPVKYYPFFMVALSSMRCGGRSAVAGVVGLVVGHGWWVMFDVEGRRGSLEQLGRAPGWIQSLFGTRPGNDKSSVAAVHVTAPRERAAGSSAAATGYQWGRGQRLGGD